MSQYKAYENRKFGDAWVDALNDWARKSYATVAWIDVESRGPKNQAEHTSIPVLSYKLFNYVPNIGTKPILRGAADTELLARDAAENAIARWLEGQSRSSGRILFEDWKFLVRSDANQSKHRRYVAELAKYTCCLDGWPIDECKGTSTDKRKARNKAAQKLIEGGNYCMFVLKSK